MSPHTGIYQSLKGWLVLKMSQRFALGQMHWLRKQAVTLDRKTLAVWTPERQVKTVLVKTRAGYVQFSHLYCYKEKGINIEAIYTHVARSSCTAMWNTWGDILCISVTSYRELNIVLVCLL